jgi:hypothetical protein
LSSIIPSSLYDIGVGNINTFFTASNDNPETIRVILSDFLSDFNDGLRICISESETKVSQFISETPFSGVTKNTRSIIQPVYNIITSVDTVLKEFQTLINSDVKESILEEFLRENYKAIFGNKYDNVSTQIWLKFPDIDIGNKERRMDLMLRNSVQSDWELFELKRPNVSLTKSKSDVPMFTAAVHNTIAQANNYKSILQQDKVKRAFANDGIEYYEPEINIVIGKKPSITNAHWRRLVSQNASGINIIPYDTLLSEAKTRFSDMQKILL